MTTRETRKATKLPPQSHQPVVGTPNQTSAVLANSKPNITGTARKKLKFRRHPGNPDKSAPMMVDPEREVPGMMDKT